jgi:hypothetical protein
MTNTPSGSGGYPSAFQLTPYVARAGQTMPVVPKAGNAFVVTHGSTAIAAVVGPVYGGYIVNPPNAASQNITTAENCYVDPVAAPGATDSAAAAAATTTVLEPGQAYTVPCIPDGLTIYVNAPTSAHALNVVVW